MKEFVHPKSRKAEKQQGRIARRQRLEETTRTHRQLQRRDVVQLLTFFQRCVRETGKESYSATELENITLQYLDSLRPEMGWSATQRLSAELFRREAVQRARNGTLRVPDLLDAAVVGLLRAYDGRIGSSQQIRLREVRTAAVPLE